MAAFNLEQRSRAVCAAYKAARETLFGEDNPPARKVTNSFKARPCQAVKVKPDFLSVHKEVRFFPNRVAFSKMKCKSLVESAFMKRNIFDGIVVNYKIAPKVARYASTPISDNACPSTMAACATYLNEDHKT